MMLVLGTDNASEQFKITHTLIYSCSRVISFFQRTNMKANLKSNKKVLLRERKRRTARTAQPSWPWGGVGEGVGERGLPCLGQGEGGYPALAREGGRGWVGMVTLSWLGEEREGYPVLAGGGRGGVPKTRTWVSPTVNRQTNWKYYLPVVLSTRAVKS